jgi:multidrug efflux pump subunit AcrA (membrane-fusion protein)
MTMTDKKCPYVSFLLLASLLLFSCKSQTAGGGDDDVSGEVVTPVTVTHVATIPLADTIELNATSVFRDKSVVKSTVNGYILKEPLTPGETVRQGQLLFKMKTKEASVIGRSLDSSLQFNGIITVRSAQDGYVSLLDHQQGDYVMDGEQLCVISDRNSFAFLLQVPFELSGDVKTGRDCAVILPDGRHLTGRIVSKIPAVDPVTQTQEYVVKISKDVHLPENLIAKIQIAKSAEKNAVVLPKTAILTNEDQTEWWVMKMVNDSTAIKVPVEKGMETPRMVQIDSPSFLPSDRILTSGNFGLPDTALVKVITPR